MSQANDSPKRRVHRYDLATMHEALRLKLTGLKGREIAHQLNIPLGNIGRLINVARQTQAQEPAFEQNPAVEDLQMPESFVAFFNWLTRRVIAAEDELQETKRLLAEKTSEATRAWAEVTAQAKTEVSRELAAVYQGYTRADRS